MTRTLIISEEAVSDLEDIWQYIAVDSPENADLFIDQLYNKCLDIAALEKVGRQRHELAADLLSIPHKQYIIFFLRDQLRVSIVRILNAARDLDSQFENE